MADVAGTVDIVGGVAVLEELDGELAHGHCGARVLDTRVGFQGIDESLDVLRDG